MSLREVINKHQRLFAVAAVAISAFLLYFAFAGGAGGGQSVLDKSFYSTDDGATYFAADAMKLAPFQHEGKEAVNAHVFKCGGQVSVHYLSRYTPEGIKAMNAAASAASKGAGTAVPSGQWVQFKRPGEKEWGKVAPTPKCPDGGYPEMVTP